MGIGMGVGVGVRVGVGVGVGVVKPHLLPSALVLDFFSVPRGASKVILRLLVPRNHRRLHAAAADHSTRVSCDAVSSTASASDHGGRVVLILEVAVAVANRTRS